MEQREESGACFGYPKSWQRYTKARQKAKPIPHLCESPIRIFYPEKPSIPVTNAATVYILNCCECIVCPLNPSLMTGWRVTLPMSISCGRREYLRDNFSFQADNFPFVRVYRICWEMIVACECLWRAEMPCKLFSALGHLSQRHLLHSKR